MKRLVSFLMTVLYVAAIPAQPAYDKQVSGLLLDPSPPLRQQPLRVFMTGLSGCGDTFDSSTHVVRSGTNIDIAYEVKLGAGTACFSAAPAYAFAANVGPFEPGTYQIAAHGTFMGFPQQSLSLSFTVPETPVGAVEYYRADADRYFLTADANEIALLDSGAFIGWSKTGESFGVTREQSALGAPVCRFYGLPSAGLDSHFFSASTEECAAVQSRFSTAWKLESANVFGVVLPAASDGSCPQGMKPVYRLFNNRADANHRYTTSPGIRYQLIGKGWTPEGYGDYGVAMCAY